MNADRVSGSFLFQQSQAPARSAPHVADKILNHQAGTISGVAAVYQQHELLTERQEALERWGAHVATIFAEDLGEFGDKIRSAA
jgi:hypothetical protein